MNISEHIDINPEVMLGKPVIMGTRIPYLPRISIRIRKGMRKMRFLADEGCDFCVVRALRKAGHDVKAIAEMSPGIPDEEVAMLSAGEMRILLTEDKDFGQMVYAKSQASAGVRP